MLSYTVFLGGMFLKEFVERITILSPNEIDDIYKLPQLSEEERFLYFTMDADEYTLAHSHRSLDMKVFFIIQLGYFKAKRIFFSFTNNEIKKDLEFIKNKYFPTESISYTFNIVKSTRWYQQQKILSLFSYHDFDANWKESLQERARRCVKISTRPIYMFKDLLDYLEKAKVVLPAYSTMQKIISKAIIEKRTTFSHCQGTYNQRR